jgi:branched-chain amino acid transport system permease protein
MSKAPLKKWLILIIVVFLAILPVIFPDPYFKSVLVQFIIFLLFAMSFNILIGDLGIMSFGHAAFFGLGGYTAGILVNSGTPWWLALLIAGLICILGGIGLGLLSLRLKAIYFAITTLALAEILRVAALNLKSLTNGSRGLIVMDPFSSFSLDSSLMIYYIGFVLILVLFLIFINIKGSWLGRSFYAIRDSEDMAVSLGVNSYMTKNIGLIISTFFAGLSGGMYGFYYGVVMPDTLGIVYTTTGLVIVLIGGRGNILGPVLGTFIFVIVSELLRAAGSVRMIAFSVLLLVVIVLLPKGIISLFTKNTVKRKEVRKSNFSEVN